MSSEVIKALLGGSPFVYVDCGARGGSAPSWLKRLKTYQYIGIEADGDESERLQARGKPQHRYLHAALGRASEPRILHVTRNPACSSLLRPNREILAAFGELNDFFVVERELSITTTTLDDLAAAHGLHNVDFLDLDVQGTALDVVSGAESLLARHVIGLQVEVEFAELYEQQALFGDVDAFLRTRGFQLFDLARYHVRRGGNASAVQTRGQLLWGQATYLRRPERCGSVELRRRLAALAVLVGVPDLALDILAAFTGEDADLARAAREHIVTSGALRVWRD
jgi:FkbM family methyltransferase